MPSSLDDSFVRNDLQQLLADTTLSSPISPRARSLKNDNSSGVEDADEQEAPSRREFVWARTGVEPDLQTLSTPLREIQQQFKKAIYRHKLTKSVMRRVRTANHQPLVFHHCTSYLKEEVILGPTVAESAILMTSSPSIHEVCFVCGERVDYAYV